MKQFYVLGFLFSYDLQRVALIHKLRPDWQRGKLNCPGGKIELKDDSPLIAMIREYKEETGVEITDWIEFAKLTGKEFEVYCFKALSDLDQLKTMELESIEIFPVSDLKLLPIIYNLNFLIPLALDNDKIKATFEYE